MDLLVRAGVDGDVQVRTGELVDEVEGFLAEGGQIFIEDECEEMLTGAAGARVASKGEAGDLLVFAVFEDFEVVRGEVARGVAFWVGNGRIDEDFLRVGLEVG